MLIINSSVWQYHNPLLNIGNQKPQCRNKENITVMQRQSFSTIVTFCDELAQNVVKMSDGLWRLEFD